jgi:hypothetical protein
MPTSAKAMSVANSLKLPPNERSIVARAKQRRRYWTLMGTMHRFGAMRRTSRLKKGHAGQAVIADII